jgi:2-phosphosulfolactate phosphatase
VEVVYISENEGTRQVDIALTAERVVPEGVRNSICVVIDVLRASTTIVSALANGCPGIVPVETPEEARKIAAEKNCLLGGERNGLKIKGFHFGNSPLEYISGAIVGRFIAFTTTNGTRAIRACTRAHALLIGSFVNASAITAVVNSMPEKDILLVCAGTQGEPSIEDTVSAGMLLDMLQGKYSSAAQEAIDEWRTYRNDLVSMMKNVSAHGRRLVELGFERDIEFAAVIDKFAVVPVYRDGLIVRKES